MYTYYYLLQLGTMDTCEAQIILADYSPGRQAEYRWAKGMVGDGGEGGLEVQSWALSVF